MKTGTAGGSRLANVSFHAVDAGEQEDEEIVTSLPPGGSIDAAERMCLRSAWRRVRSMPGLAEKGGFIRMTVGRSSGRRSAIDSALCAVTGDAGKSEARSRDRTSAISLRWSASGDSAPSAHCAMTASMPVPAEGSRTMSPGRIAAACSAA